MTLSTLINQFAFDTVIPFFKKDELNALNIELFQLRELYDLLRNHIPASPIDSPIYAGLFKRSNDHWESGLRFLQKQITFEDMGRQVSFMQGGSLIPAELVVNCLVEYLSQDKPEQIYNTENEPLIIPYTSYTPYPKQTNNYACTHNLSAAKEADPNKTRIKTQQTPRGICTDRARIRQTRLKLCNQWHDLLTPDQRTAIMLMTHGVQLTYRDLSPNEEPLTYVTESIQRYTTLIPYCFDTAICRVAHPQALPIEPEHQSALHEALNLWLGHNNIRISQSISEDPHTRCHLLLIQSNGQTNKLDK